MLPIVAHHRSDRAPRDASRGEGEGDEPPRAVHRGRAHTARIVWLDARATDAGVRIGMTLAAARARAASLRSVHEDARMLGDEKRRVVERLLEVSPRIEVAGATRFWVEPLPRSGSLDAWCALARRAMGAYGAVAIGVGPTATVAWAAARSAPGGIRLVDREEARDFLDDAPLEALEIDGEARDLLAALGIRTVGQLRRLSPGSLGRRLGPEIALARRRADGDDPRQPQTPRPLPPRAVALCFDDEQSAMEPLLFVLGAAIDRLASDLSREGLGATEMVITLGTRGGGEVATRIRTSAPVHRARTLRELARTHLERRVVDAPITALRVAIEETAPAAVAGPTLFGEQAHDPSAREVALGRLRARFGEQAVKRAERREVGPALERARYRIDSTPTQASLDVSTPCLPWRRLAAPLPVEGGAVWLGDRRRRVVRLGRVERTTPPWWETGRKRVELLAWAELEGPVLALLRARVSAACDDEWELIAWVD